MTNVLELSADDTTQPLYALALPFGATINEVSAELQSQFLQNQLQALVNQVQQNQTEELSNIDNSSEAAIDTIEEVIQDEGSWTVPVCSTSEGSLNINGLNVVQSQSILNGISDEIQNIEYLIQEEVDDHIEAVDQTKDCDTSYMISLNGMQYGIKLVPSTGSTGLHCSQVKILLNSENNVMETSGSEQEVNLSTLDMNQESHLIYDDEISDIAVLVQAYKCRECYFTVEDKNLFIEHYRTQHIEKIPRVKEESPVDLDSVPYDINEIEVKSEHLLYMCGQCSQGYTSIEECRTHMINDHKLTGNDMETSVLHSDFKNKYPPTDICIPAKIYDSNVEDVKESHWLLIKNIKELKSALISDWKMKCTITNCPYRFRDNECLDKHIKCHTTITPRYKDSSTKNFSCSECSKEFLNWRSCSVHLWRDHLLDVDMLTCPVCKDYKTPTTVKLSHHMKIHSVSRGFVCGECGKAFKQASQLHNHKVLHAAGKKTQAQRWYTAKNCEICAKTFANSKCLKKHVQAIHSKIRPFICNVCGHSCSRKAMLQMHLRQHTGEKPYACTECEYRTSDHNTLRRHIMRHTGVRPYRCPYCPYAAIQSCAFKMHMKSKHRDKPGVFACKNCPFQTVNKSIYESHMSDHEKGLFDLYKSNVPHSLNWKYAESERMDNYQNISSSRLMYNNLRPGITMSPINQNSLNSQDFNIQISSRDSEDDDTQHCFLTRHHNIDNSDETVDTGGVTIPADIEIISSV